MIFLIDWNYSEINDKDEKSFISARSNSTTRFEHQSQQQWLSISLDDFVQLEKTIENETNQTNNTVHLSFLLMKQSHQKLIKLNRIYSMK
jgi:hypothetical protein